MIKPSDPRVLAIDLLPRSTCSVRVASVVTDAGGNIISWGWNHSGPSGYGLHAEHHAILRANKARLWYGTIYVAGRYDRGTLVNSKPCKACQGLISKYKMDVVYRAKSGDWHEFTST